MVDLLASKDRVKRMQTAQPGYTGTANSASDWIDEAADEIARLEDAIWEYGQHRKSCRIDSGLECDCGFFDIIKTLHVR